MCSVCQSNAILVAGKGRRGLANSTYYMGLDLGMTLGPVIGGMLMGNISVKWFYPDLLVTIPLCFLVYVVMKIKRRSIKKISSEIFTAYLFYLYSMSAFFGWTHCNIGYIHVVGL